MNILWKLQVGVDRDNFLELPKRYSSKQNKKKSELMLFQIQVFTI